MHTVALTLLVCLSIYLVITVWNATIDVRYRSISRAVSREEEAIRRDKAPIHRPMTTDYRDRAPEADQMTPEIYAAGTLLLWTEAVEEQRTKVSATRSLLAATDQPSVDLKEELRTLELELKTRELMQEALFFLATHPAHGSHRFMAQAPSRPQ